MKMLKLQRIMISEYQKLTNRFVFSTKLDNKRYKPISKLLEQCITETEVVWWRVVGG